MDGNKNMLISSGTQSINIKNAKAKKEKIVQEDGSSIEQSRQHSLRTIGTKTNMSRTVIDEDLPGTVGTINTQNKPEQDDEAKAMSEEKILLRIVSKKAL